MKLLVVVTSLFLFHNKASTAETKITNPGNSAFTLVSEKELRELGVDAKRFGEAWREPVEGGLTDNVIWGDLVSGLDGVAQSDAQTACKSMGDGVQLPTAEDFQRLRSYMGASLSSEKGYVPQLLPNLTFDVKNPSGTQEKTIGRAYWTAAPIPPSTDPNFQYTVFDGKRGRFIYHSGEYRFCDTRCVFKPKSYLLAREKPRLLSLNDLTELDRACTRFLFRATSGDANQFSDTAIGLQKLDEQRERHHKYEEDLLLQELVERKQFECEVPSNNASVIVLSGEMHGAQANPRQQQLFNIARYPAPDQKTILYLIEGATFGSPQSVRNYSNRKKVSEFENDHNVDGVEQEDSVVLAGLLQRAQPTGPPERKSLGFGRGVRVWFLEYLESNPDWKKLMEELLPQLPGGTAKTDSIDVLNGKREPLLNRGLTDKGWDSFLNEVISLSAERKYSKAPLVRFRNFIRAPDKDPDFGSHYVLHWRNAEMVHNIAKKYCEALKAGADLYLTVGACHLPGLGRLLKKIAPPTITIQHEVIHGSWHGIRRYLEYLPD